MALTTSIRILNRTQARTHTINTRKIDKKSKRQTSSKRENKRNIPGRSLQPSFPMTVYKPQQTDRQTDRQTDEATKNGKWRIKELSGLLCIPLKLNEMR
ncbi:hypothetical protein TRV_00309 [Trichophyton verrucosum HKI 0517]|uniref:Uncharacterized protein n=1 Tax=Trichophyton verrucosum (strain HKI 0517) TaxID=663202 RepID=D4CZR7_TRIVH|nr:uncharacterized protein TRV_00309 [Trichophyton verrucosum HKI 0517]EFE44936.1 hypothetical protein TRV_00309 [Trichophyton verrucosum HKI 0517]